MRNAYLPIAAALSFLLMLTGPPFPKCVTASGVAAPRLHVTGTAQQFAQEESSDSDTNAQPDQSDDSSSSDNSDQPSAQPGDENEGSSEASPPDENSGESPQMNSNPEDSNNADQSSQSPDDQQNQENPPDAQ